MKNTLTSLQSYFRNIASMLGVTSSWQRVLSTQKRALGYLNRVPIVLFGRTGRSWILINVAFYRIAKRMYRTQGSKGLALFLKVSQVSILKFAAGQPLRNGFGSLGHHVRFAGGLPAWLPPAVRKEIRRGNSRIVRYMLSLTNLYRVVEFKGKPAISTILQPGTNWSVFRYYQFVGTFFCWLSAVVGDLGKMKDVKVFHISKSGPGVSAKPIILGKKAVKESKIYKSSIPGFEKKSVEKRILLLSQQPFTYNVGTSTSALVFQAMAWSDPAHRELRQVFKMYCEKAGIMSFYSKFETIVSQVGPISFWRPLVPAYLGKLGIKEEPGKVRVFAMVDWWTQVAMRPLHDFVFGILKRIPSDGTHDQGRAVRLGMSILARKGVGHSFDLSAATDRLPVLLQSFLVNHLFPGTGQLWASLLTDRQYQVPVSLRRLGMKIPKSVLYAVGQPMGALSSWAMLALTHHFIVQFAAYLSGSRQWFHDYVLLGDDIVIFDDAVASQYLLIMEDLGVKINLVKSVQSKDSMEFAKRFISKGVDVSPLSFRELDTAGASLDALLELVQRFQGSGMRLASVLRIRGFGYRVLGSMSRSYESMSRRLRFLCIWLTFPRHTKWSYPSTLAWLTGSSLGRSSKTINVESLRSILQSLAEAWDPSRFYGGPNAVFLQGSLPDGGAFHLNRGPTDVLGPTGLWNESYPGLGAVDAWRISVVKELVSPLLWPIETTYFGRIKASDNIWRAIDVTSKLSGDLSDLESLLEEMLDHRILDSLLPSSIDVGKYRDSKVKLRAGRWLNYWVKLRKAVR